MSDAFCLCGAQAGYPHDPDCPRPLFKGSAENEFGWERDYLGAKAKRAVTELNQAAQQLFAAAGGDVKRAKDLLARRVGNLVEIAASLHGLRQRMLTALQESPAPAPKGAGR